MPPGYTLFKKKILLISEKKRERENEQEEGWRERERDGWRRRGTEREGGEDSAQESLRDDDLSLRRGLAN